MVRCTASLHENHAIVLTSRRCSHRFVLSANDSFSLFACPSPMWTLFSAYYILFRHATIMPSYQSVGKKVSSSADPKNAHQHHAKKTTRQNNVCTCPSIMIRPIQRVPMVQAHPPDFFAPNLRVNFFFGGAMPSPPGVVAVGEGAALDAALLLILWAEL